MILNRWLFSGILRQPRLTSLRFCLFSKDYMSSLLQKLQQLEQSDPRLRTSQLVLEQKNDCVFVRDTNNQFGFMKEVTTQEGSRGAVVDIRQKVVGIALYRTPGKVDNVSVENNDAATFSNRQWRLASIYDIEGQPMTTDQDATGVIQLSDDSKHHGRTVYTGSKEKKKDIPILNPLLKVTQDINKGDFIVFEGPYGSGKTSTALQLAQYFCRDDLKSIVLYLNLNLKDCQKLSKALPSKNWLAFSQSQKQRSDAGGLILALKTVNLAKRLREQGHNVLIIIQNMNEIFRREISMLKNFQQNIAAFSVINELYCWTGVPSTLGGNITSIVTLQQQITRGKNSASAADVPFTPYVNSINHMHSLAIPIRFPLQLRISQNPRLLSRCVNRLLHEEKDYELKSKLKVNTEPWQNYFRLDSKWWVNSLKKYRAQDPQELELFIRFIEWNIETERVPHWAVPAHQAFKLLKQWASSRQILFSSNDLENSQQVLEAFVMHCKIQGIYLPFAKDYLN